MPGRRGLFVRKDASAGTSPQDARLALAGLVAPDGDLAALPGVLSGCVASGTSGWTYSVSKGHYVVTRGESDGVVVGSIDGATSTNTVAAAPASGSRWDLIWVRQADTDSGDSDSAVTVGATSGVSGGSPSKPYGSVPAGALVVAEALVSAGATQTSSASVVITQVARRTVARGGILPVTTTQRTATVATPGTVVYDTTLNQLVPATSAGAWDEGAWQAWTPGWTNFIPGSSTIVARMRRNGKTVEAMLQVTIGSGFGMNSNFIQVSQPVARHSQWLSGLPVGSLSRTVSGVGYVGPLWVRMSDTNLILEGIYAGTQAWGPGDQFSAAFSYEVA